MGVPAGNGFIATAVRSLREAPEPDADWAYNVSDTLRSMAEGYVALYGLAEAEMDFEAEAIGLLFYNYIMDAAEAEAEAMGIEC